LRGVDLGLADGKFIAIMGPSGCGKSTLLNLVAGLDTADDGEIVLAGDRCGQSEDDKADAAAPHRHRVPVLQLEGMTVLGTSCSPPIAGTKRKRRGAGA
jgi:putative ABC transport system ATP-binding protein